MIYAMSILYDDLFYSCLSQPFPVLKIGKSIYFDLFSRLFIGIYRLIKARPIKVQVEV